MTPNKQYVAWRISLQSDLEAFQNRSSTLFGQFEKTLEGMISTAVADIQKGVTQEEAFAKALGTLANEIKTELPGAFAVLEKLTKNFDPKIVRIYGKEILQQVSGIQGIHIEPLFNEAEQAAELYKTMGVFQQLAKKSGADFAKAFEYSSLPYLQKAWRSMDLSPDSTKLKQSVETLIKGMGDEQIPQEFFESLSDPKYVNWWVKNYSKVLTKVPGSKEFKTAFSSLMKEAARKGFMPEFAKIMEQQGQKVSSVFGTIFKKTSGKFGDVISIAVGDALSSTVGILTGAVTDVFKPFLEALSYTAAVALNPLQVAILKLFYVIQTAILKTAQILGRLIYKILPIFESALKLLYPVVVAITWALLGVELILGGVADVLYAAGKGFSWLGKQLGKLGEVFGFNSKRAEWFYKHLAWLGTVANVLGIVIGTVLAPILTWYALVGMARATLAMLSFTLSMNRGIVTAVAWAAKQLVNIGLLRYQTLSTIQATWSLGSYGKAIKIIATQVIPDMLRGIKLHILNLWKQKTALWANFLQLMRQKWAWLQNTLGLNANTKAVIANTAARHKWKIAAGGMLAMLGMLLSAFGGESETVQNLANWMIMLGTVLPFIPFKLFGGALGYVAKGVMWLGGLLLGLLVPAIEALGLAIGVSFGWAVAIVVGAVALILGAIYLVWKYWDNITTFIVDTARTIWGAITSAFSAIWDVMGYFSPFFLAIKTLHDLLVMVYHDIVGHSPGLVPALELLKEVAVFVFNVMMAPIRLFSLAIRALWEGLVAVFQWVANNWPSLTDIFLAGLGPIGTFLSGIVNIYKDSLGAIGSFLQSWVQKIPKPLRWLLGLDIAEDVVPPAIDQAAAKQSIAETGSAIQGELNKLDATTKHVIGVEGVDTKTATAQSVVSWQKQGEASGQALASSFAQGQVESTGKVAQATEAVAKSAADYLPHSDAKEGPLSGLVEAGRSFVTAFTSGLSSQKNFLEDSLKVMFSSMIGVVPVPMPSSVSPQIDVGAVDFQMEPFSEPTKFADPIVSAISGQTADLISFVEEVFQKGKDLDVSDLQDLSRFER